MWFMFVGDVPQCVPAFTRTDIHTGRLETRLLILIGASQTRAVCGDHSRRVRKGNSQRKRRKDEAPNERWLIFSVFELAHGIEIRRKKEKKKGRGEESGSRRLEGRSRVMDGSSRGMKRVEGKGR